MFDVYSSGVKTNRDTWVYNFFHQSVIDNMTRMIDFYNQQVEGFKKYIKVKIIRVCLWKVFLLFVGDSRLEERGI
uniref:type ISP restriction/modification enzyme n=1 Tax=Okeania sp. SIO2F4 TaxID=2607790 RepID=UPI003440D6CD